MAAYSNCHFVSASFPQHATDCATYDVSHQRLPLRRELHGDLPTSHQVCGFLTNLHDIFKGGRGGGELFLSRFERVVQGLWLDFKTLLSRLPLIFETY